jgi:hypothetical protein
MALTLGIRLRLKRGRGGGGEREFDHLLTAAENVVCTAAGTRLVLLKGKHYLQTANHNTLDTSAGNKIRLVTTV